MIVQLVSLDNAINCALGLGGGLPAQPGDYRFRADVLGRDRLAAGVLPGSPAELERDVGELTRLFAKEITVMHPGDVFVAQYCGGGGFGDPLTRIPELVAGDVRSAAITAGDAESLYGVVLDGAGEADVARTAERRRQMRADRLAAAHPPAAPDDVSLDPDRYSGSAGGAVVFGPASDGEEHWGCHECGHALGHRSELQGWRRVAGASAAGNQSQPIPRSTRVLRRRVRRASIPLPGLRRHPRDRAVQARRSARARREARCARPGDGMSDGDLTIGVDIGGTFTDCTIVHDGGAITTGKSPTTPDDRSRGFFDAISDAATKMGSTLEAVLQRCGLLVHGTTTGTNAIVERRGAATGLLATRGHEDAMFVMKGQGRTSGLSPDEALDVHSTRRPEPLVPRAMVRPITERIDVDGEVIVPLDEGEVGDAVRDLVAAGARALTISFLWSTMNPVHEQRARAIAAQVAPDVFISCSSDLSSRTGEYERTMTAVMNSYIGPLMLEYVDRIQDGARERGFQGSVQFAQCAGGAITSTEARHAPVRTVHSGPVAGTIAMAGIAERTQLRNVIAVDMGGTTFDVSVIHDGRPLQRDISVFERYAMALPMLDIESIGAGGGSIAWIDDVGRLNVGPRSAGARPGPACYGFGGTEATVTDADVVLGLVNPDNYLGGRMRLDRELAEAAMDRLADSASAIRCNERASASPPSSTRRWPTWSGA